MNMLTFFQERWLPGCLLLFLCACAGHEPAADNKILFTSSIKEVKALSYIRSIEDSIHTGDLVTRTGNDFTSYCFRQFCQVDKSYSHCGIASLENDTLFIYHALGGEFNPEQKILREPLQHFASPKANTGLGVFRFRFSTGKADSLVKITRKSFIAGIIFDMEFDLGTDDKMYCSEFTAKMYRRATGNDTLFRPSKIGTFEFLSPDNLFTHPSFTRLYEVVY